MPVFFFSEEQIVFASKRKNKGECCWCLVFQKNESWVKKKTIFLQTRSLDFLVKRALLISWPSVAFGKNQRLHWRAEKWRSLQRNSKGCCLKLSNELHKVHLPKNTVLLAGKELQLFRKLQVKNV